MHVLTKALAADLKTVRLVTEKGNEIVEINKAFALAEEEGLDLVCVSDESDPPVVKISDFKRYRFQSQKKKSKRVRTSTVKEVQLKVNISDHDLETKMKNISRFLDRGDKVKLVVKLKGRERDHPERAKNLMLKVVSSIKCKYSEIPGPMTIAMLEPQK